MKKLFFVALALLALAISAAPATAAPLNVAVSCPGTASTSDREFTLTATTELAPPDAAATCFASGVGNLNNDEFANPPWILLDKDSGTDGICETCLSITGLGTTSGTFTISAATWATYSSLLIGFKSGEGQLDPDWAAFQLTGGITGGTWSISDQQSLSHANLWGATGGQTIQAVPEPATLVLLGTGLIGTARAARRRIKRG